LFSPQPPKGGLKTDTELAPLQGGWRAKKAGVQKRGNEGHNI